MTLWQHHPFAAAAIGSITFDPTGPRKRSIQATLLTSGYRRQCCQSCGLCDSTGLDIPNRNGQGGPAKNLPQPAQDSRLATIAASEFAAKVESVATRFYVYRVLSMGREFEVI
jgi:hypothetical protein